MNHPGTLRTVWVLAAILAAGACDSGTEPDFSERGFTVNSEPGQLVLENERTDTVHYVAIEQGTLSVLDLVTDPSQWPALEPGGREVIPHADLTGYFEGATHGVVVWAIGSEIQDNVVLELR